MKTVLHTLMIAVLLMGAVGAQGRQAAPPSPPAAARPAPVPDARSSTNIRVDVTLIEEGGGAQPVRKTVSLTSIDGLRASSRSTGRSFPAETNLNVDATPTLRSGKIHTRVTLFYRPSPDMPERDATGPASARVPSVNLDFPIVLEDGKMLVASRTTDPVSDRTVTVEVTATILK
jgi:hypothetical protein